MKKYLFNYINDINDLIAQNRITKMHIENHINKIAFFQHERLIHLLVTLFYALLFILFFSLGLIHYVFFIITLILMIFLIFYIIHYFRLENCVQHLYKQYDNMIQLVKSK